MVMHPTEYYNWTAEEFTKRILEAIPDHPEILEITDPWILLRQQLVKTEGLDLTVYMAGWALNKAKSEWKETYGGTV